MHENHAAPRHGVPAPIEAHRARPTRPVRDPRATAAAPRPTPAIPARGHGPRTGQDAARMDRTVVALRRLQTTLVGMQHALDAVIAQVEGAKQRRTTGAPSPARATADAVASSPARRTPGALPAAPEPLAPHLRPTAPGPLGARVRGTAAGPDAGRA